MCITFNFNVLQNVCMEIVRLSDIRNKNLAF